MSARASRMCGVVLALTLTCTLTVSVATASAATLAQRIGATVSASPVRGSTSVFVWDQETREVLYARQASRSVAPASTMKLLTSAAALARLGEDYVFTTRVALTGTAAGSTWVGDVYLIGGGDPSLSTAGFARDNMRGVGTNIAGLISPLQERGITRVEGRLIVDDGLFDSQRYVRDWPSSFRYEETGALGALTVNQAQLGRWIGGRSSRMPDVHAGTAYRALLSRAGITVTGATTPGTVPASAQIAGFVASAPLGKLLHHMNQTSDNFYAEILLKDIGADRYGSGKGTTANGRRAAKLELEKIGVNTSTLRWSDGSGLSYANAVDARLLGRVLGVGAQADWGEAWIASFARAGRSPGTLQNRMTTWPYRDRVQAKTGTLRHVSALAGFAERLGSQHRYGFATITYNSGGSQVSYGSAKMLQDRIAKVLVR